MGRAFKITSFLLLSLGLQSPLLAKLGPDGEVVEGREPFNIEIVSCPSESPELLQLFGQMSDLKGKLTKEECKQISGKLDAVNEILNPKKTDQRSRFLALIKNKGKMLTPQESEEVRGYASEVSGLVSDLIDSVNSDDGNCLEDKETKAKFFSRSSNIILAVTEGLSQVTGPYGVPISIAGNIAAGVMVGIGKYQKEEDGLDYVGNPDHVEIYARSLCSYFELRKQIVTYLKPQEHLDGLRKLKAYLQGNSQQIVARCEECRKVQDLYYEHEAGQPLDFSPKKKDGYLEALRPAVEAADKVGSAEQGSLLLKILRRLRFVEEEIVHINVNREFPGLTPSFIHQAKLDMDKWFLREEAPKFLAYHVAEAERIMRAYQKYVGDRIYGKWGNRWRINSLYQMLGYDPSRLDPETFKQINEELHPPESRKDFMAFKAKKDAAFLAQLEKEKLSARAQENEMRYLEDVSSGLNFVSRIAHDYCDFFAKVDGFLFPATEQKCQDPRLEIVADESSEKSGEGSTEDAMPSNRAAPPEARMSIHMMELEKPKAKDWLSGLDDQLAQPPR